MQIKEIQELSTLMNPLEQRSLTSRELLEVPQAHAKPCKGVLAPERLARGAARACLARVGSGKVAEREPDRIAQTIDLREVAAHGLARRHLLAAGDRKRLELSRAIERACARKDRKRLQPSRVRAHPWTPTMAASRAQLASASSSASGGWRKSARSCGTSSSARSTEAFEPRTYAPRSIRSCTSSSSA